MTTTLATQPEQSEQSALSALERRVRADPELQAGLAWGSPRRGHPEGAVAEHVATLLSRIADDDPLRDDLRFLALVHDSFKSAVRPEGGWSPENDHAVLARRFAERHTTDERLLAALELHDEPYWQWRNGGGVRSVLERVPDVELFARFVELDASTEGKDLSFLWWFRRELALSELLPEHAHLPPLEPPAGEQVVYVKAFAVEPEDQDAVAAALRQLVAEHAAALGAAGDVLVSDDGLRVLLTWTWRGPTGGRLLRDGDLVRDAMQRHPVLRRVQPLDARVFRAPAA